MSVPGSLTDLEASGFPQDWEQSSGLLSQSESLLTHTGASVRQSGNEWNAMSEKWGGNCCKDHSLVA